MFMDMHELCKELRAEYRLEKGILGTAPDFDFAISKASNIICHIEQNAVRTITINADEQRPLDEMYSYLTAVERLLVIIDGVFIPLTSISFPNEGDNREKLEALAEHIMVQRLHYFESAKFLSYGADTFADYWECLPFIDYLRWKSTMDDLGVLHQMFLYASSHTNLTNDVMLAFLVELMEGLEEYYRDEYEKFGKINPNPPKKKSLAYGVNAMIHCFGKAIFSEEIKKHEEAFVSALVNSRVNIMHIKRKQKEPFLDGKESTLYAIKMNYLYRWALLEYIGVPTEVFSEKVEKRIRRLNEWNSIMFHLLNRL